MYGCASWTVKKAERWIVGEDSWESFGLRGDPTSPFWRRSALVFLWKNDAKPETPVLGHLMRRADSLEKTLMLGGIRGRRRRGRQRGEGDNRGWGGWMASLTRWTWVWVNSGSWWWTGRPGMLRFIGSQRVGHDWVTELNWTEVDNCKNKVGFVYSLILLNIPSCIPNSKCIQNNFGYIQLAFIGRICISV